MDENVQTSGSYAWQSILKAREVVALGSTWPIGNGYIAYKTFSEFF